LKWTLERGILLRRNWNVSFETDYAGSVVDIRSTTNYCTFLGENLVIWKSKKQSVIAWSSVEVELPKMAQVWAIMAKSNTRRLEDKMGWTCEAILWQQICN